VIKKLFKLTLFSLLFSFFLWFSHRETEGFSIGKISSELPFHSEWEVPSRDEAGVKQILNQKFTYLGRGAQCYAFLSEDRNYVLKFFRHAHLSPPFWMTLCSFPGKWEEKRLDTIEKRARKLAQDFGSYTIAYTSMQEETGLLYLHLNKTSTLKQKVTIFDRIGIIHHLDLDKMEFLVQRRADLIYPTIEKLLQQDKIDSAQTIVREVTELLAKRARMGIFDKDPDIATNFGVIDGHVAQIDVGRFSWDASRKERDVYKDEIARATDTFHTWLKKKSPELAHHLTESIDAL
jgi:hypothetical protein